MWGRKRSLASSTASEYVEQARLEKAELAVEKATSLNDDEVRRAMLESLEKQALEDEKRVQARILALREARERNHFTDRLRGLLEHTEGK